MSENDWAEKIVTQILLTTPSIKYTTVQNGSFNVEMPNIKIIREKFAAALKQEREIATLEMEAKYKKIQWPTEAEIKDEAKHEDSDGYFGFISGCEWLKNLIEEKRK